MGSAATNWWRLRTTREVCAPEEIHCGRQNVPISGRYYGPGMGSATATTAGHYGEDTESAPSLHWFARWLGDEHDRILDSLVDRVVTAVPDLAVAHDDPRTQMRNAVQVHLRALTECVGQSPHPGPVTLPAFVGRYTRAMARHGTPRLLVLLRAFEEIHAALWRLLVVALREGRYQLAPADRAEVLEQVSAHLFAYFQTASTETAAAYTAERALLDRRASAHRTQVVTGVLAGSVSQADAERALAYALNTTHIGYVAWVDQPCDLDRLDRAVTVLVEQLRPRQHLSVPVSDNSVFGWVSSCDDQWSRLLRAKALPAGIRCAWGAPHPGMGGFRATHLDALEARRVGEATGLVGAGGSVLFDDVAVAALASHDLASATAFVRRQLGRLADGSESAGRLLQTLHVYLDELASPTRTARRLHVHPNTVVKRVERIETLLGRRIDPASLSLRVAVELAPMSNSTATRER